MAKTYFISSLLLLSIWNSALCCDCIMTPLQQHIIAAYDILIGEAIGRTDTNSDDEFTISKFDSTRSHHIVFRIDTALKGTVLQKTIQISGETNCDLRYTLGHRYILFVDKQLKTIHCSYSGNATPNSASYTNTLNYFTEKKKQKH